MLTPTHNSNPDSHISIGIGSEALTSTNAYIDVENRRNELGRPRNRYTDSHGIDGMRGPMGGVDNQESRRRAIAQHFPD